MSLIVGDFYVLPNENLRNVLNLYEQLIERSTFLSGSILDHFYVKQSLASKFNVEAACFHSMIQSKSLINQKSLLILFV